MGIRETLNRNPGVTIGIVVAVIIFVGILIFRSIGGGPSYSGGGESQSWYSTDDGATYFADDASHIPPYTKDGKQAVRVYVYKCGNGQPFVGYLERYTAKAQQALQSKKADQFAGEELASEIEVKKPKTGDKGWARVTTPQARQIMMVMCPDGKPAEGVPPE